jgi:hypothetical protein
MAVNSFKMMSDGTIDNDSWNKSLGFSSLCFDHDDDGNLYGLSFTHLIVFAVITDEIMTLQAG